MKKIILTFLFFCFFISLFILGYNQGKPVDENKEKLKEIVQETEAVKEESPLFRALSPEERKKRIESFKKLDSQEIKYEEKKLTQKENTKKEHEVALTKVLLDFEQGLNPKEKYDFPGLEKFKTMHKN